MLRRVSNAPGLVLNALLALLLATAVVGQEPAAVNEMRVMRMSGELIEAGPALEALNELVMRFRAKVLSTIPRIAKEAYGASNPNDALERAETLADEILTSCGNYGRKNCNAQACRSCPRKVMNERTANFPGVECNSRGGLTLRTGFRPA